MKKIFYILASAIVALGAVACQNEVDENINPNDTKEITFNVSFDESTRIAGTVADGKATFEFEGGEELYVGGAKLTNSTEAPTTFVADAENSGTLNGLVDQTVTATVNDEAKGLKFASETFKVVAGENNITLSLACPALHFTVPTGTEVALTVNEVTKEYTEGSYFVGIEGTTAAISYAIDEVTVKQKNLEGMTNKVYNLGTLGAAVAEVGGVKYTDFAKAVAAADGGIVTLVSDVAIEKLVEVSGNVTIEGAGLTVSNTGDVFKVLNGGSLTIGAGVTIESATDCGIFTSAGANDVTVVINGTVRSSASKYAAVQFNGGTTGVNLTVNGTIESENEAALYLPANGEYTIASGAIITGKSAIVHKGGKLTIEEGATLIATGDKVDFDANKVSGANCTGDALVVIAAEGYSTAEATINGGSFTSTNGAAVGLYAQNGVTPATVSIKGGTFNTDPSAFVAEGYVAAFDGTNYIVDTFANAVKKDNVTITLGEGTFNMPAMQGNTVTIKGTTNTIINANKANLGGGNLTLEGVTINAGSYNGFQHSGVVTYNNATINNSLYCYGVKDIFNECVFNITGAYDYVYVYGSAYTEFNECTFNTKGKAIILYNEGDGANEVKVTNCIFNAETGAKAGAIANQNCAAIEIDNFQSSGTGVAHKLTTSGNTVGENFSGEWRIKNYVAGNPVTVNGTEYTQLALDGKLMVKDASNNVSFVEDKTLVEKLNEQIAAGESTITISESFEMTASDPRINIPAGSSVNITLAEGVEITGTFADSGSDALFNIAKGGELTIGGEGAIILTSVKGDVSNYGQYIFENCGGVLNITGGTYNMEVTGNGSATWFIPTLINNNSTSGETTTNISGGYFYSETCINIMRQFINHKSENATFNITGGEFEGTGTKTYGIWNQNSGGSGLGFVNISGDAKMNNVYVENDAAKANAVVWGGSFGYEPGTANSSYNAVTIKEGYKAVQNGTVWTVEVMPAVIRINNMNGWADLTITVKEGDTVLANAQAMTKEGDTNVFYYELDAEHIGKNVSYYITHSWYQTTTKNVTLANECEPIVLNTTYLQPADWDVDSARFAAYCYGDGEVWYDAKYAFTTEGKRVFEVELPADKNFTNIIWGRMNGAAAENKWENRWNQTSDLTLKHMCYCISDAWDQTKLTDTKWY